MSTKIAPLEDGEEQEETSEAKKGHPRLPSVEEASEGIIGGKTALDKLLKTRLSCMMEYAQGTMCGGSRFSVRDMDAALTLMRKSSPAKDTVEDGEDALDLITPILNCACYDDGICAWVEAQDEADILTFTGYPIEA